MIHNIYTLNEMINIKFLKNNNIIRNQLSKLRYQCYDQQKLSLILSDMSSLSSDDLNLDINNYSQNVIISFRFNQQFKKIQQRIQ
ncbi:hypothetical protein pb186bvf_013718 [Paramecium bursaria]